MGTGEMGHFRLPPVYHGCPIKDKKGKIMAKKSYLAVDMGASSGRLLVGHFDGKRLELEEVHRYANGPVEMAGNYYWNLPGLWSEVQKGLMRTGEKFGAAVESVGVDTWGVDYAYLDKNGKLLGNPYCYRDPRTDGAMEKAFETVPRDEVFANTGLQFMQLNTLYQILADKWSGSVAQENAERFLMIPDIFHWLLSGVESNEFTDSTTTQFFDPVKNDWAKGMLEKFGIPTHIFKETSQPGTILGPILPSIAAESGLTGMKVVLPGSHDTASAVLAVPTACATGSTDWAYVSLGTWALMGIESPKPVVSQTVSGFNFTNEGGVGGTTRILKNICGMWLLQECRRVWNQKGRNLDWDEMNQMTRRAPALTGFIDPDARDFLSPTDMPEAIRQFMKRTGQPVPTDDGTVIRVALESIAMKFRQVLAMCDEISGGRIETLHIVGGGIQNKLLCQAAADATGCHVVTGPIEATAMGNVMMQAIASGDVAGIPEARAVVRDSFDVTEYLPQNTPQWDDAFERFMKIVG